MKALIVAEGEHERSGALETLVRRLAAQDTQLAREKLEFKHDSANRKDIHTHRGKGQGFFKRALRWMLEARKHGFEALILVIDEDGDRRRVQEINEAQEHQLVNIRRALGVAIRTFDAWMLADEQALTEVLGGQVPRQKAPEGISDPKNVCEKLRSEGDKSPRLRDMYTKTAERTDLETLETRCPRGFAPFAERVREQCSP